MNRISRELLSIAREISALDEEGDGSSFQFYHDQENNEQQMLDLAQKQGKKYILHHKEGNLWRIQACKTFYQLANGNKVKKGDFGGLIESEKNLSQDGSCWVFDGARVNGTAKIYEDACVYEKGKCGNSANVYGKARVHGNASVWQSAQIFDNADIYGQARIHDVAKVYGWAEVQGGQICEDAQVYEHAKIFSGSFVGDRGKVHGNAEIKGKVVQREEITE